MRAHRIDADSRFTRRWLRTVAVLASLMLVLAACNGDIEDDGPQFVNDPRPTTTATVAATPTDDAPAPPTAAAAPTQDPGDLLETRSAPRFVYLIIDSVLTSYDSFTRAFVPLDIGTGIALVDHTASPTGDRAAILAVQNNRLVVQFFGADGLPLGAPILLSVPALPNVTATPTDGTAQARIPDRADQMHIDWVPQGNAVLVSGPGVSQHVSMSGAVMPISRTGALGTVVKAIWSPMDSQVAIQTQLMDGSQHLYMLNTGHDEATELTALDSLNAQSLSNVQWLPSGLGLVMVAGSTTDGVVMHGQLYVYRFDEATPTLVATSGQGGPNATITHAVVSPDGHSVVYAVMVNDLGDWYLHSLWVKSIKNGSAVEIPTTSAAPITSLQWSAEGVVWQQADGTTNVVDTGLEPRSLGSEPPATPEASSTNGATPVASPEVNATPVG